MTVKGRLIFYPFVRPQCHNLYEINIILCTQTTVGDLPTFFKVLWLLLLTRFACHNVIAFLI